MQIVNVNCKFTFRLDKNIKMTLVHNWEEKCISGIFKVNIVCNGDVKLHS